MGLGGCVCCCSCGRLRAVGEAVHCSAAHLVKLLAGSQLHRQRLGVQQPLELRVHSRHLSAQHGPRLLLSDLKVLSRPEHTGDVRK